MAGLVTDVTDGDCTSRNSVMVFRPGYSSSPQAEFPLLPNNPPPPIPTNPFQLRVQPCRAVQGNHDGWGCANEFMSYA
jgi:hypothetical protein